MIATLVFFALLNAGSTRSYGAMPDFPACSPESEFISESPQVTGPKLAQNSAFNASVDFCATWNPEFRNNGGHCCGKFVHTRKRGANRCDPARRKSVFCDEMTPEQIAYTRAVQSGALPDVLADVSAEMGRREQSYCSVNTGFLAHGRRVVPTPMNLIAIRSPNRCVDFGTDPMVGMIEWLGRQIKSQYSGPEYKGVRLVISDVAAPRGGCLTGRGGRRGHASHTTGQDADIGFLTIKPGHPSPLDLHRNFDPKTNWWMIKKILKNPYACVRVIFLDKKLIRKLQKEAANDPEWLDYRRFIRHAPAHKNHMHVRVGDAPGLPGCGPNARPDLETEDALEGTGDGSDAADGDSLSPVSDPSDGEELYRGLPSGQPVNIY